MSPDTPDPHRSVDRPDEPDCAAAPAGPAPPARSVNDGWTPLSGSPDVGSRLGEPGPVEPATPGGDPWSQPGGPGPAASWPPAYAGLPEQPADRPRRPVAATLATVLALTVLGVPLGLLWAAVAPDTPVLKTAEGAIYAQPQPEQPIAADGWFSLLGLGFGLLAAVGLWVVLRRRRGPAVLTGAAFGALGAALVAWQVGRRVGLSGYQRLLENAPDGTAFTKPADLRAGGIEWLFGFLPVPFGDVLLPAFAAAVTYTLLAGWSRWPSLRPEPEPGGLSWGPGATPAPTAAPEPPAPGAAEPPRG
ncbi:uncharacterized protein DUF2567 [Micromonospora palomenae]|uniref:Uncharacterized protein DUF2567 n=1 Tax=Micromonospora palomenae TaxID=1461247 RepID=A0A561VFM9_9ACTN|nr:uncharacterized protein DUF2567 [Micromonospora palomenae]